MRWILLLVAMVVASPALAQTTSITCTVPSANLTRIGQLCESLRIRMRVSDVTWDNEMCADNVLRVGFSEIERTNTTATVKRESNTTVNDAVGDFTSTWPPPPKSFCGDNVVNPEVPFNEECDDGNNVDGDGCDSSCRNEP